MFDKITARIMKLSYGLNPDFCDPVSARSCMLMFAFKLEYAQLGGLAGVGAAGLWSPANRKGLSASLRSRESRCRSQPRSSAFEAGSQHFQTAGPS